MKKLLVATLILSLGAILAVSIKIADLTADLPQLDSMKDYRPPVVSKVYDRNGQLIAGFGKERRTIVPMNKMPKKLVNAFIAAEDGDFYSHQGIDLVSTMMAAAQEVKRKLFGGKIRGGSTITQQTAKTFLLSSERSYMRKAKEIILAYRIEQTFKKDEILHLYLNQIYFGNGAYGVEEAAQTYFGKHVEELSLAECATLASMPKSPNEINPIYNPNRTLVRRTYVLEQLRKKGLASEKEIDEAMQSPLVAEKPQRDFMNRTQYVADEVRRILEKDKANGSALESGAEIRSTVDARATVIAQEALEAGLIEVDHRLGWRGPLFAAGSFDMKEFSVGLQKELKERLPADPDESASLVWDMSWIKSDELAKNAGKAADAVAFVRREPGNIATGIVYDVDDKAKRVTLHLGTARATMLFKDMAWARKATEHGPGSPPKLPSEIVKTGDIVLVRLLRETKNGLEVGLEQFPAVQGALVAIQPQTHEVIALAGGANYARSNFNRATQAKRQPGSSFKPFIYAEALASRKFTAATLIDDSPRVFINLTGDDYSPGNSDGKFRGDITLRECLTHSVNTCSLELVKTLGVARVVGLAKDLGLEDKWSPDMSLALGTGNTTPLKLANAYAMLADSGHIADPLLVRNIRTAKGAVTEYKNERRKVMDADVAYVTLQVMRSVIESGTAQCIKKLGRPVAGKTGTTSEARDTWFAGCTPELCTVVWVGKDNHDSLGPYEAGGRAAAPIFLKFYEKYFGDAPVNDFTSPPGVVTAIVNRKTGEAADEGDEEALREVFLEGTVPTARSGEAELQ